MFYIWIHLYESKKEFAYLRSEDEIQYFGHREDAAATQKSLIDLLTRCGLSGSVDIRQLRVRV